ncbi:MAG: SDR family oxidoreductase, partial [Pseudomonadota bacterium]
VTGANRGIGLELCRQLARSGWRVTGLCRANSGPPDLDGVEFHAGFDVTDAASIQALAADLEPGSVDLLINNAGILQGTSLEHLDLDSMRQQFEVNTLGPLRVTQALLPALSDGATVALITSRMGSIADNTSGGSYGYRMSKAALNAAGKSLAHDLAPRGIKVATLHPGYVRTDMTGHNGLIDVEAAASGLLARIAEVTPETSGTFWHANGDVLPW